MAEFIEVREVGLRDGIQNIKTVVPTDLKLAWIKAEVAAGVRDIEVCSFVPPKLLPQFADAEEVTKAALQIPGLTVAALMPNLKGAERGAALGVHRLDYVVSVSEEPQPQQRAPLDRGLARRPAAHRGFPARRSRRASGRSLFCGLATSFGCTIEGNVPHDRVVQFAEQVAAIGVDEIALADTVGFGNPNAIRTLFTRVLEGDRPEDRARRAFPRHARARHRERRGRDRRRRAPLRCLAVRARRLPVRAGRDRQYRHRGRRVPRRVARLRHRHRSRPADRGARDRRRRRCRTKRCTGRWRRPACRRALPTRKAARRRKESA